MRPIRPSVRTAFLVGLAVALPLGATGVEPVAASEATGRPSSVHASAEPCKAEKKLLALATKDVKRIKNKKSKAFKKARKVAKAAKQDYESCTLTAVRREPVGTKQPNPFARPKLGKELATDEQVSPVVLDETTTVAGGQPGLYGGTVNYAQCDKEQLKAFLTGAPTLDRPPPGAGGDDVQFSPAQQAENRRKGAAWAKGLGPVKFPAGSPTPHVLTPDEIPAYIDRLTPLVLTANTQVTNNGYSGGEPEPHQSVLQAGWAVLVDEYAVPRTKCFCGNSLRPPENPPYEPPYEPPPGEPPYEPPDYEPPYYGPKWKDYDPKDKVYVVAEEFPVERFEFVDKNGDTHLRPAGSSGAEDTEIGTPTPTPNGPTPREPTPPGPTPAPDEPTYYYDPNDGCYHYSDGSVVCPEPTPPPEEPCVDENNKIVPCPLSLSMNRGARRVPVRGTVA